MSTLGRRSWGWWNGTDMLPLEIQLAALPPPTPPLPRAEPAKAPRTRGTEDKTGQGTRTRIMRALLSRWGPVCHLCILWGVPEEQARIDLKLKFPHPECFTRDHVKPRSLKGSNAIRNQRPAHHQCNSFRGNKTMLEIAECRPPWVSPKEEAKSDGQGEVHRAGVGTGRGDQRSGAGHLGGRQLLGLPAGGPGPGGLQPAQPEAGDGRPADGARTA